MLPPSTGGPYSIQGSGRVQAFDASTTPYTSAHARPSYPSNYPSGVEAISSQYGMTTARHGLPINMSQAPTPTFSTAEIPQSWASLPSNARPLPSNYAYDTDLPSNYQSTAIPLVPSNAYAYHIAANDSVFPGMSPLASSLPYSASNRTLPNPASVQSSLHGGDGSILEADGGIETYSQHLASRSSISSATRDAINASEGSSSTASSSPSDTNRPSNPAYGNTIYSSHAGGGAGGSNLPPGGILRRISDDSSFGNTSSGTQSNQLGSNDISTLNSSYGINAGHGGFGSQTRSANTSLSGVSTLSEIPTGIHHPQPQYSRSQDVPSVLGSTVEAASGASQRTSTSKSKGRKVTGKR